MITEMDEKDQAHEKLAEQFIKEELHSKLGSFSDINSPLLIVGAAGLPLLPVAKHLAKKRICSKSGSEMSPCGVCSECVAFQAGQSTRVKVVVPDGQFVKVEQARDVMEFLSFKRDKPIAIIIHDAHKMNVQAANSLLKTLEEPPENCWIILTAPSAKSVIATVRSRVLVMNIPPLTLGFVAKNLAPEQQKNANLLQGRWDRLKETDQFFIGLKELETWLGQVARKTKPEPLEWMDSKDGFLESLEKIRLLLKDKLLNGQFKDPMSWINLVEKIDDLESACLQNVDRKILMDHLYMAIEDL